MTSETSNSQCNQGSSLENDKCANYNSEANEKSAESSGPTAIHKNEFSDSGLEEVRKVTEKLKLNPRRPSIAKWMAENQNGGFRNRTKCLTADKEIHLNSLVNDKFSSVDDAIHWIKNELVCTTIIDINIVKLASVL